MTDGNMMTDIAMPVKDAVDAKRLGSRVTEQAQAAAGIMMFFKTGKSVKTTRFAVSRNHNGKGDCACCISRKAPCPFLWKFLRR